MPNSSFKIIESDYPGGGWAKLSHVTGGWFCPIEVYVKL
jgi:hypothetical protein